MVAIVMVHTANFSWQRKTLWAEDYLYTSCLRVVAYGLLDTSVVPLLTKL